MILGQRIILDENHPNGVSRRVMEKPPQVRAVLEDPDRFRGAPLEHHLSVAIREILTSGDIQAVEILESF